MIVVNSMNALLFWQSYRPLTTQYRQTPEQERCCRNVQPEIPIKANIICTMDQSWLAKSKKKQRLKRCHLYCIVSVRFLGVCPSGCSACHSAGGRKSHWHFMFGAVKMHSMQTCFNTIVQTYHMCVYIHMYICMYMYILTDKYLHLLRERPASDIATKHAKTSVTITKSLSHRWSNPVISFRLWFKDQQHQMVSNREMFFNAAAASIDVVVTLVGWCCYCFSESAGEWVVLANE